MEIVYQRWKLQRVCENNVEADRKFGENAKLLRLRLGQLRAAESLEQIPPDAHCHELTADRAGQLAVSLKQPFRLVFEVADNPIPTQPSGGLDWKRVRSIRILEVANYHG